MHELSIDNLPEDVIRQIVLLLDVNSIVSLSQTRRASNLISIVSDDRFWGRLVNRRFGIDATRASARSKSYGGSNWKNAYVSLSQCNRLPRCRLTTKRKPVMAKSCGKENTGVNMWILMGHTDDCNTRVKSSNVSSRYQSIIPDFIGNAPKNCGSLGVNRANNIIESGARYVELHVGVQIVSPFIRSAHLDLSQSYIQLAEATLLKSQVSVSTARILHRSNPGSSSRTDDAVEDTVKAHNLKRKPRSKYGINNNSCMTSLQENCTSITLKPLEFVVVAINIRCTSDMRFETDFLSRAMQFHVPTIVSKETLIRRSERDLNLGWRSSLETSLLTASFLAEMDLWYHYMMLPGGFLQLVDKYPSRDLQ